MKQELRKKRVYIAGHTGMVGSAIARILIGDKKVRLITKERAELDLTNQDRVQQFFVREKIDEVYLAAARVGGIHANRTYSAEFLYENLMIASNIINSAYQAGVTKLLFLGSSCIYPKNAEQPIVEEALLTGRLEETNESYAIAKIAGIKLCESFNRQYSETSEIDYRSVMPCNLYGPGDNYHGENSHVIPALIKRFHAAKENKAKTVIVWGSGKPRREFLFVEDAASAMVNLMNIKRAEYRDLCAENSYHINIGAGEDISIAELAEEIRTVVGYEGEITFDNSKPDGVYSKLMNSSRLRKSGWEPKNSIRTGLLKTYKSFKTEDNKW
ncbi:GDP-L-fucose synthase [Betaproteobacteria bacterium LSUCC0117]|nr:GDP-L-fucose synthase [Betaproteobacteria bacterium LSUCC0117]